MNDIAEKFQKSSDDELFLAQFNEALVGLESSLSAELPERLPTLHVVGVPRSGTTLASQLLSGHLDIGYISNFVAAFWQAPVVGARLWKKLVDKRPSPDYQSTFGRTRGLYEPHEFGYFWRQLLGYGELREKSEDDSAAIDWSHVRKVLININEAFAAPTVYKSIISCWHVSDLYRAMPKSCFVHIRRDRVQNALSLLRMRQEFMTDPSAWASVKPHEYDRLKDRSLPEQLAGQVHYVDQAISRGIAHVPARQVIEVSYEDICREPGRFVGAVEALLNENGAEVNQLSDPPESFESNSAPIGDPDIEAAIKNAFDVFEK